MSIKSQIKYNVKAFFLNEYPNKRIDHLFTPANTEAKSLIPNVVYQTWISNKLGRTHFKNLEKFRNLNPDYSFEFFDNIRMDNYMKEYYGDHPIYQIYMNLNFGAPKTDIWRYCILFQRGGVYFDINKSVNLPLREIIYKNDKAIISFEQNLIRDYIDWDIPSIAREKLNYPDLIIINWGFAFTAGHVFLSTIIENIVKEYPIWRMKIVPKIKDAGVQFTGPLMMTKSIWQALERNPDIDFKQFGIDFYRHGNYNMKGSWSRYILKTSYSEYKNKVIVS